MSICYFYDREELKKARKSGKKDYHKDITPAFSLEIPVGKERSYAKKYDLFDDYVWIREE